MIIYNTFLSDVRTSTASSHDIHRSVKVVCYSRYKTPEDDAYHWS